MILWIVLTACALVAGAVFGVMIYSIATFPRPCEPVSGALLHRRIVEVLWAIIPIAIIAGTAAPALKNFAAPGGAQHTGEPCVDAKNAFHEGCGPL